MTALKSGAATPVADGSGAVAVTAGGAACACAWPANGACCTAVAPMPPSTPAAIRAATSFFEVHCTLVFMSIILSCEAATPGGMERTVPPDS